MEVVSVVERVFEERGIDIGCLLYWPPEQNSTFLVFNKEGSKTLISIHPSMLENKSLHLDFANRLANICQGIQNEYTPIEINGTNKWLFPHLGYVIREPNTHAEILLHDGEKVVYACAVFDNSELSVFVHNNLNSGDSSLLGQKHKILSIRTLGDILPNPSPLFEEGTINWLYDVDSELSYKGANVWIYNKHNIAYVKSLGWMAVHLNQLEAKLGHFPVELQDEFEVWRSLR